MFNIINLPPLSQSSYLDCNLLNYKNFIKTNINNISMVRMDYSVLIQDISHALGITNKEEFAEIGNIVFNNEFIKRRKPILSIEFINELSDYLIANEKMDSLLSILYVYDIPVFINGVDYIDKLFGSGMQDDTVLMSNELDNKLAFYIKQIILNNGYDINDYILSYRNDYFFGYKDSVCISLDDVLPSNIIKIDYDTLLREFYGKSKT